MKKKKETLQNLQILRPIRVYVDTSVFGGYFDDEFGRASVLFFKKVKDGFFKTVVSSIVADEVAKAPLKVKELFDGISGLAETPGITKEAIELRDTYLKADIVSEKWAIDALHVAMAVVSGCSMIVSWNFKHIVNFRKIPLYNGINQSMGYREIGIFSPQEVVENEE